MKVRTERICADGLHSTLETLGGPAACGSGILTCRPSAPQRGPSSLTHPSLAPEDSGREGRAEVQLVVAQEEGWVSLPRLGFLGRPLSPEPAVQVRHPPPAPETPEHTQACVSEPAVGSSRA